MKDYEIVIDSTADLDLSLRSKFGVYHDYLHCVVYLPDQEIKADLEWNNISFEQYFDIVKKKVGSVRTSFATYEEFCRVVTPILKSGKDVIIITISSGISGTYSAYCNFANMLLDDFPNSKIEVIDSLKYSVGIGLLAIYGALNKKAGMSFEDNVIWLKNNIVNVHEIGPMDDLSFLAKNGRISATKAFFGQLAGVQPVADFTIDGKSLPLGTIRGDVNVNKLCLLYLQNTIVNPANQIVLIAHTLRQERAELFKKQLEDLNLVKEVYIVRVGQSCGPNIGPGLCAYFYLGKSLSTNREDENNLFNKLKDNL